MGHKKDVGEFLDNIVNMPEEILPSGKYLILPIDKAREWKSIFTEERLRIISILKSANPISQTELAEMLGRKRENVIHDLKVLHHVGLVRFEKEDNKVITKINKDMIIISC